MGISEAIDVVLNDVSDELVRATSKFGAFNSAHEGFAVLEEEFLELRSEVFTNPIKANPAISKHAAIDLHKAAMRSEAIQVAAMAMRFVMDVCNAD